MIFLIFIYKSIINKHKLIMDNGNINYYINNNNVSKSTQNMVIKQFALIKEWSLNLVLI